MPSKVRELRTGDVLNPVIGGVAKTITIRVKVRADPPFWYGDDETGKFMVIQKRERPRQQSQSNNVYAKTAFWKDYVNTATSTSSGFGSW